MLAIFQKGFAHPPQELKSHHGDHMKQLPKTPEEILHDFHSANSDHPALSISFNRGAALASASPPSNGPHLSLHQRLLCCLDEVYCMFVGNIYNLSSLIRQYGLSASSTNEAMLIINAYCTLRDRCPYPADQVLKDLNGSFAFVIYDNKVGTVFAASSSDGGVPLFWGLAADGSVVICDDLGLVKSSCAKSFAPFPNGCMFHSEGGLKSFERPMNKMKAMPRVDSGGRNVWGFLQG